MGGNDGVVRREGELIVQRGVCAGAQEAERHQEPAEAPDAAPGSGLAGGAGVGLPAPVPGGHGRRGGSARFSLEE